LKYTITYIDDEEENRSGSNDDPNNDEHNVLNFSQPGSPHATENEVEENDSFLTDNTDYTYQTENSNNFAEVLTTKKYIMTMKEVNRNEPKTQKQFKYDCSSPLPEKL
jgi:hypothetical protein